MLIAQCLDSLRCIQVPPCLLCGQCAGESCRPYFHGLLHSKGGRWVKKYSKQDLPQKELFKKYSKPDFQLCILRGRQQSGGEGESWGGCGGRLQAGRQSPGEGTKMTK